jgi:hypothetical protein
MSLYRLPAVLTFSLLMGVFMLPFVATKQASAILPPFIRLPRLVEAGAPRSHPSHNRRFVLYMVPHDWMGRSGATYRFERDGEQLWSDERNYTLKHIVVTDSGFVVGVAYRDIPVEAGGQRWDPIQILHVIILNNEGSEILNDEEVRQRNSFSSNPPRPRAPYAEHLLVDPDNDRIVMRVLEPAGSVITSDDDPCACFPRSDWRVYQLSTGKRVFSFNPEARSSKNRLVRGPWIVNAAIIRNTPLILTHAYSPGAHFEILDPLGYVVWSLSVENDYAGIDWPGPRMGRSGPGRFFRENPAILSADQPNRFDLRFFATNERITFEVVRAEDDSWAVSEVERKPFNDFP